MISPEYLTQKLWENSTLRHALFRSPQEFREIVQQILEGEMNTAKPTQSDYELMEEAASLLADVHTGTDFECECWELANKLRAAMGTEELWEDDK
jgi:hypothetical protein